MKEERIYMQPLTSMNELIELIGNELYDKKEANEETDKIVSDFLGIQKTNIFFNERNHFIMLWSKYKKFGIANEILGFKVIYSDEMFLLDKHFIFCRIPKTDMEMFVNEYLLKKENEQLQAENTKLKQDKENLTTIVANKIVEDFDIETPLKDELNNARLEIISLEEALHIERQEKQELLKWLEEEMNKLNPKKLELGELNLRLDDVKFYSYIQLKGILERLGVDTDE